MKLRVRWSSMAECHFSVFLGKEVINKLLLFQKVFPIRYTHTHKIINLNLMNPCYWKSTLFSLRFSLSLQYAYAHVHYNHWKYSKPNGEQVFVGTSREKNQKNWCRKLDQNQLKIVYGVHWMSMWCLKLVCHILKVCVCLCECELRLSGWCCFLSHSSRHLSCLMCVVDVVR